MKKTPVWAAFPYPQARLDYAADALKKQWPRLHRGDREPYPGAQYLAKLCKDNPQVAGSISGFDGDFQALSHETLEAWRHYHRGDFADAAKLGTSLGWVGYPVAAKAMLIYATYLADQAHRLELLESLIARAGEAIKTLPVLASSHYFYAAALGRHSQKTSVMEALARGLGGKIKDALSRTLELESDHAEAHIAFGTYHVEIVAKVGSLIGGLTYGASTKEAIKHYEKALALHPQSALARVEYAQGLLSMFGKSHAHRAGELLGEAVRLEPRDAMERLDVELAKSELARFTGEQA